MTNYTFIIFYIQFTNYYTVFIYLVTNGVHSYCNYTGAFSFTVLLQQFGVNNFPPVESLDLFSAHGEFCDMRPVLLLVLYSVGLPRFRPFLFKLVLLLVTAAIPCHLIRT